MQLLIAAELGVLGGEAVTVNRSAGSAAGVSEKFQTGDGRALIEKLFGRQAAEAKVLPPGSLLLTTMPVENIGKEPPRLLFVCALRRFEGYALSEPTDERRNLLLP